MKNQYYIDRSLKSLWNPCTQMKIQQAQSIIPIRRGDGVWLFDYDDKKYLDAISSWWVNLFGHNQSEIKKYLDGFVGRKERTIVIVDFGNVEKWKNSLGWIVGIKELGILVKN